MNNAELPQNLRLAADSLVREQTAEQLTQIIQLEELENMLAGTQGADNFFEGHVKDYPDKSEVMYEELSDIGLLKHLNKLDIAIHEDDKLKTFLEAAAPIGSLTVDSLGIAIARLNAFKAYNSAKLELTTLTADQRVLEAQRYQIQQLNNRKRNEMRRQDAFKIAGQKTVWAANAAENTVTALEAKTAESYQQDCEDAHAEDNKRQSAARIEAAKARSVREVETFLAISEFVGACEKANFSIADVNSKDPDEAIFILRKSFNEWTKTGVVRSQDTRVEVPVPIASIKEALQFSKFKPKPAPSVTQAARTAGQRAFDMLPDPSKITAVSVVALGGTVSQRFVIERNGSNL